LINLLPIIVVLVIIVAFFYRVFLYSEVPLPADFTVGIYYPWLDYQWEGFPAGVPVKNLVTNDVASYIYPIQSLAVKILKQGEIPLWNPYILAGTPLFANFQSAAFSPTIFVYFLFDKLTAWSAQIILQHIFAALFTYLLLRRWKVSKAGSILGAIIFAFSGFNLIWSQWNGHVLAAALIPLVLFFADRFLEKGRFIDGAGITISLSAQILSGYPQIVFYSLLAILILWLSKSLDEKRWLFKGIFLFIFSFLSFGLSAPQILAGAELLSRSQRIVEQTTFEWAFLPWNKIITFLAPDFFGNPATQNYWSNWDYFSNVGFVGVVAFTLTLFSTPLIKKRKEVVFCFLIIVVSLLLSFPTPISIYLWKSGVPGFNAVAAHRALVLFNLSIALLAGIGNDRIREKFKPKYLIFLLLPLFILFTYWIYIFTFRGSIINGTPVFQVGARNLILPTTIFFATSAIILFRMIRKTYIFVFVLLLCLIEIFYFGWKYTPFSPRHIVFPTTPVLEFLMNQEKPFRVTGNKVIPINMRVPFGLESLEGYDAVYPLRTAKFISFLNSERPGAGPMLRYGIVDNDISKLLDLVNTKYYLTHKLDQRGPAPSGDIPEKFKTSRFKLVFEDKSVAVLESESVLPRAFMVYDWETIKEDEKIIRALLDPDFPIDSKIILEEDIAIKKTKGHYSLNEAVYEKYGNQESIIKVDARGDGLLFVSDTYYPGWKAYVDGKESRIYRANYAFRAVFIPEGEHEVRFVYRPDSFFNGLKISGLSALSLIMLGFVLGRRKPRSYT